MKINKSFLADVNRYPINTTLDPSEYDEVELKLAGGKMFESNYYYEKNKWHFPPVTTILNAAMPEDKRKSLIKWQVDQIATLGFDGYQNNQRTLMKHGTEFHKAAEMMLKRQPLDKQKIDKQIITSVDTLENIIETEFQREMVLIEKKVFHRDLFYNGQLDCLGYYKNSLCVIDWKRSERPKTELRDLYEYPVQTSAYIGAFLNDPEYESIRKQHNITNALLINITYEGVTNFHILNYHQIEFYWYRWLTYLQNFWYLVLEEHKREKSNLE